jgi:hypothetical protein
MQVFSSAISNVFLPGISTGQLAQLLPQAIVPPAVQSALLAAAAARPSAATAASSIPVDAAAAGIPSHARALAGVQLPHPPAANSMGLGAGGAGVVGPVLSSLQEISSSAAAAAAAAQGAVGGGSGVCISGGFRQMLGFAKNALVCAVKDAPAAAATAVVPAGSDVMKTAGTRALLGGAAGQAAVAAGDVAAADHMLLLFVLEHLLLLAMLVVYWCIPSEPAAVRLSAATASEMQQNKQHIGVGQQPIEEQQQQQCGPFARMAGNIKTYINPLFVPFSE